MDEDSFYDEKEVYLVRRKSSIVWKLFEKLNRSRVRCKICNHVQNYQGTTGNILRHLRNKHDMDVTQRAISENPDILTMIDSKLVGEKATNTIEVESRSSERLKHENFSPSKEKLDAFNVEVLDPYTEEINDAEYLESGKNATAETENTNLTAEEEKIIAETEYFREKADYYRMQRNLVALQAKKIKLQIEQMTQNMT